MPFAAQHIRTARNHLRRADPRMREVIHAVGPFTARTRSDRFAALAGAIVGQQISGSAARSIWERLQERLGGRIDASLLRALTVDDLRETGVSRQKAGYLLDLAARVADGELELAQMGRKSDETVIAELTQVKGIGEWTAQMFLIFSLGRLDVLPVDDLGIRSAIRHCYGLRELPRAERIRKIARPWRPWATVASWYLWRWLDVQKKEQRE